MMQKPPDLRATLDRMVVNEPPDPPGRTRACQQATLLTQEVAHGVAYCLLADR